MIRIYERGERLNGKDQVYLLPSENRWIYGLADNIVEYCRDNNLDLNIRKGLDRYDTLHIFSESFSYSLCHMKRDHEISLSEVGDYILKKSTTILKGK